ncbi:MAG: hypothetical protein ACOCQX_01290 [Candidatus Nanoarchaeia archaeon]
MNSKIHFYLSTIFLFLGFFVLMAAFLDEPGQADINAKFISPQFECSDKTPVGECSKEHLGNMCKLEKEGPRLSYSPKCYE